MGFNGNRILFRNISMVQEYHHYSACSIIGLILLPEKRTMFLILRLSQVVFYALDRLSGAGHIIIVIFLYFGKRFSFHLQIQ